MKYVIFIPSIFIFLLTLYKLVKDDYIFLRRNIKLESVFDIAFIVIIISSLFDQINILQKNAYLNNLVISGGTMLFILGTYRKFPLGRLFDFFSISFLTTLPVIYFLNIFFSNKEQVIFSIISAAFYLIVSIFFLNKLFKSLISRTIKEGNISIYFFLIYSLYSFLLVGVNAIMSKHSLVSIASIVLFIEIILSIILYIKQNLRSNRSRL